MAINKVVYGSNTLIDLTGDTAVEEKVLSGFTFHKADGTTATGTNTFDSDTQDATASSSEILDSKTAYVRGAKVTGSMPNIGSQTGSISTKNGTVAISQGYHDGSGSVGIAAAEKDKIIATNIRQGVSILGVTGSMTGSEDVTAQASKTVTPTTAQQTITPDTGYDYLSQVVVNAIPYSESDNAAGGKTVTIG